MTGRWRTAVPAVVLGAAAVLIGTAVVVDSRTPPASNGPVAVDGPTRPEIAKPTPEKATEDSEPRLLEVQQTDTVAAPTRIEVPSLGISSALDRLGTDGRGRLDTPPRWQVAGWFAGGPRPGADGPAVIAGHVDSPTGPAVFARLSELQDGDVIRVIDADDTVRVFTVTSSTTTPQDGFPTDDVYGPTPDSQLRLITCDGPYDTAAGAYQNNLLVFATEVDA